MRRIAALLVVVCSVLTPQEARLSHRETYLKVFGDFAYYRELWDFDPGPDGPFGDQIGDERRDAEAYVAENEARWKKEVAFFLSRKHPYPELAAAVQRPYASDNPQQLNVPDNLRFSSKSPKAKLTVYQYRFAVAYSIAVALSDPARPKLSADLDRSVLRPDFVRANFDLDRARVDKEIESARAKWIEKENAEDLAFQLALFAGINLSDERYFKRAIELAFEQYEARRSFADWERIAEQVHREDPPRRLQWDQRAETTLSQQMRWLMNALPDRHLGLIRSTAIPRFAKIDGEYAAIIRKELEDFATTVIAK